MSVTLKLADNDAALIGQLLEKGANLAEAHKFDGEPSIQVITATNDFKRHFADVSRIKSMRELAGAFNVAVKANSR